MLKWRIRRGHGSPLSGRRQEIQGAAAASTVVNDVLRELAETAGC
jgi:hypothetical protein